MIKPTKKQKRDGEIDIQSCEWNMAQFVMRGDYTHEQILDAAIKNGILPANERDAWENLGEYGRYYQCWFKAVPDGSGQYSYLNFEATHETRGAYFASVVERF
ncbi:hypothetical protein [Erwinia phage Gungnir39]|nr:hypothetical protein [Erwinia phage Gungnir39]